MQNKGIAHFVGERKKLLLLFSSFIIYSFESVFAKIASGYATFSFHYFFYFGCVLAVLGCYAVLWQKVLEVYPLNKAFLCKSVTIVIILALSHFLFGETISLNNILGTILIIMGIATLSWKK